jgi:hypothetical protein
MIEIGPNLADLIKNIIAAVAVILIVYFALKNR